MFLVSKYTNPINGIKIGFDQFVVKNFTVQRGFEGSQVLLSWERPENYQHVEEIIITRKQFTYPENENDGKIIFQGLPDSNKISDTDNLPDSGYVYYIVWSKTDFKNEYVTTIAGKRSILALKTGDYFAEKMWEIIPEGWRLAAKKLETGSEDTIQLYLEEDAITKEKFNLYEEIGKNKNVIQRLFKVFGGVLDEAKQLAQAFEHQWSPSKIRLEDLQGVASLIGLDISTDLPGVNQRNEVEQEVSLLKIKGTKRGLAAKLRAITQFKVTVLDINDYISVSLPGSNDPSTQFNTFTYDPLLGVEQTSMPISGSAANKIRIIFELNGNQTLTKEMIDKIKKVVPQWLPVCLNVDWDDTFIDQLYREYYETEDEITEINRTEVENRKETELVTNIHRIIANDVTTFSNSEDWRSWWVGEILEDRYYDQSEYQQRDVEYALGYRWLYSNYPDSNFSNSKSVSIDTNRAKSIRDLFFDTVERDVIQEKFYDYNKWIWSNDENRISNSRSFLSAFFDVASESWYDEIEQIPAIPLLVSRYSDPVTAIIPDEMLVSRYSSQALLEQFLISLYSESVAGTP